MQVAEIGEGRGEIAHLRSEIGGSLVLQLMQPEHNHGGGDTDRESSAGRQDPDLGISGGQADIAYDAVDGGDQVGSR